jgi:hypothetical protein
MEFFSRGRHVLKIDPFDQPDVQDSKDITKKFLDTYKKEGRLPGGEHLKGDDPGLALALREFMRPIKQGDYLAFNAFISPTADNLNILQSLRVTVRDRLRIATTAGFGPRYLHSTGQIHKGGAANGFYSRLPTILRMWRYRAGALSRNAQVPRRRNYGREQRAAHRGVHSIRSTWNLVETFETALR